VRSGAKTGLIEYGVEPSRLRSRGCRYRRSAARRVCGRRPGRNMLSRAARQPAPPGCEAGRGGKPPDNRAFVSVSIRPMIKITIASSSSVKPGENEFDASADRFAAGRIQADRNFMSPSHLGRSRRLTHVYVVAAFDSVWTETISECRRLPSLWLEVGGPPRDRAGDARIYPPFFVICRHPGQLVGGEDQAQSDPDR